MKYSFYIVALWFTACQHNPKSEIYSDLKFDSDSSVRSHEEQSKQLDHKIFIDSVKISPYGVLTLAEREESGFSENINILNENGSIWSIIQISKTGELKISDLKGEMTPFAYHPDFYLLVFLSDQIEEKGYRISVNNGDFKWVEKNDLLVFNNWEVFIPSRVFSVRFDPYSNPIRIRETSDSGIIPFTKDTFYHPVEIKKDWLKIKWGSTDNWNYGWIKWKFDNYMIVELYYFA